LFFNLYFSKLFASSPSQYPIYFAKSSPLWAAFNCKLTQCFIQDDWGSCQRNIPPQQHVISKKNTQAIERKNLTLRTHIKRLCRKSICFSKSVTMHDVVFGLTINIWEFGLIYNAINSCRT